MLDKFGPYQVSSRLFWQKINQARANKQSGSIPTLVKDEKVYKTDFEKVNIFASLLNNTYSANDNENDFDKIHKLKVNKVVSEYKFKNDLIPFTTYEIIKAIKKIKISSSPGVDKIHNIFLKNMPYDYVHKVLAPLVNRSVDTGIPNEWKIAKIIMIPKSEVKSNDPEKYRPISLTSCLGKLTERLIKSRLYKLLEEGGILAKQQSRYKYNKGAADNLVFFTTKDK